MMMIHHLNFEVLVQWLSALAGAGPPALTKLLCQFLLRWST